MLTGVALAGSACHQGAGGAGGGSAGSAAGGATNGAGGAGGIAWSFDAGLGTGGVAGGGCPGDAGGPDAGGPDAGGCEGVAGGAGYAAEVAPIFAQRCTGELCHVAPTRAALVGVPSTECCGSRLLVVPGDAARSYLLDKLTDHDLCAGGRMPLGADPLPDADVLAVRRWICAGALAD